MTEERATPVIGPVVSSDLMTSRNGPRKVFTSISLTSAETTKEKTAQSYNLLHVKHSRKLNFILIIIVFFHFEYSHSLKVKVPQSSQYTEINRDHKNDFF